MCGNLGAAGSFSAGLLLVSAATSHLRRFRKAQMLRIRWRRREDAQDAQDQRAEKATQDADALRRLGKPAASWTWGKKHNMVRDLARELARGEGRAEDGKMYKAWATAVAKHGADEAGKTAAQMLYAYGKRVSPHPRQPSTRPSGPSV